MLLRGANVIMMSGATTDELNSVLANQDILITENRIAAIGASGSLASLQGMEVVDVTGKYIVPGFIDTHAHDPDCKPGLWRDRRPRCTNFP